MQLGIENTQGLVNQVDARTLAYAKARAAEMVGKKWVDGELVDNPAAEWVITDATRNEINSLVSQVMDGSLKVTDLPQSIMDAGAFSKDRAVMISRTEVLTANAQGSLEGYRAAKSIGLHVLKAWEADSDACEDCLENEDAGPIELDGLFPSGDECPTAHPSCRCVLISVVEDDEGNEEETQE
jgi:hypothetical protein